LKTDPDKDKKDLDLIVSKISKLDKNNNNKLSNVTRKSFSPNKKSDSNLSNKLSDAELMEEEDMSSNTKNRRKS
jgi:hypothetical protein